jgi:hypothetical protein
MVVTEIDGVKIKDLVNISNVLGNKKRGESVQLLVKVVNRYSSGVCPGVERAGGCPGSLGVFIRRNPVASPRLGAAHR